MAKKNKNRIDTIETPEYIDCACLIHDVLYSWDYVDRLYNSLCRNLTPKVRFHVYTEKHRIVPGHMIHHELEEWVGIRGPKKSWWYKIQLFDHRRHRGQMLYLDLDTVVCGNIDWIWCLPPQTFWAVRDFKYLFRPNKIAINSSVMWFDPAQWNHIYREFDPEIAARKQGGWHGDQDYIQEKLVAGRWSCFDTNRVKSWRWELLDGGFDFKRRCHNKPGFGTMIPGDVSLAIFHGSPKPHECSDSVILQHWN